MTAYIHLDVEGVALCQILLVSSVFEADASPTGTNETRFRRVVTWALHPQIRMVIYRFFQQTRKPKKNAKTSPLVSKTFPFSDVKKKKTFLWLSLLTDKSGKKGRKGILLFLTTFVRLRQSRFSCSPSFLPEMACHVTQHVPQTIDMPYYGSDFIRHFFVTFQRGRWFFVFSNDNLITTKPPKKK